MITQKCTAPTLFTVSLGKKWQIVIPKEARDMLNIVPGDKLILVAKDESIMCLPADKMEYFVQLMQEQLTKTWKTK
jgi:AbrB family looped-hinge helix DNA binding protein